ncbi:MAG: hypothetical protein AB7F31_02880 [Parachlamydiales bacterium]
MGLFKKVQQSPEVAAAVAELRQAAINFKEDSKAHAEELQHAVNRLKEAASPEVAKKLSSVNQALGEFREIPGDVSQASEKVQKKVKKLIKSLT